MASPGIYGKHPRFGDFISAGLPPVAAREMVPWWHSMLADTSEWLGERWSPVWDAALPIRFWIGGAVWGGAHLHGVARASRDSRGQCYPLFAVAETAGSPPMLQPDQGFYRAVEAELMATMTTPEDLHGRLAARTAAAGGRGPVDPAVAATFWAANPALDVADLLAQLNITDQVRAVGARSYWWVAARDDRASAVLACDGLPRPGEMAWLLAGVRAEALSARRPGGDSPRIASGGKGGNAR